MTPEKIFERLQLMGQLSATHASPMPRGVDMSRAAIAARLRDMSDASALCWQLATGRISAK